MISLYEDDNALARVGQEIGVSSWISIDQRRITEFGQLTLDPDAMHIDPAWAAQHSPYGKTFAFGFLTVSLLTAMCNELVARPADEVSTLNYGFDRLRLLAPVLVDSRVRGRFVLRQLSLRSPTQYRCTLGVTVEVEGLDKPALVADWLMVTNVRKARQLQPAAGLAA